MNKNLLNKPPIILINCIKEYMNKSPYPIIPDFMVDVVDVKPDGSCQFRALANNINHFKNVPDKQLSIARDMYRMVKHVIVHVLPSLTNKQLIEDFKFEEINLDTSPLENINNLIFEHHSGNISDLDEYFSDFKYGVYTTNLELRVLLSNYLDEYWINTFGVPSPCVSIYLNNKGSFNEISCINADKLNFINFRLFYINNNHYQSIYIKPEFFDQFNNTILQNSCKMT